MRVLHEFEGMELEKNIGSEPVGVLSNGRGSFLFLSARPITKYNGFFLRSREGMFKTLHNIRLADKDAVSFTHRLSSFERDYGDNSDDIECFDGVDGFLYSVRRKARVALDFDCRRADDMRNFGQYYRVTQYKDTVIVEYVKRTDSREDSSEGRDEFRLYAAIESAGLKPGDVIMSGEWRREEFSYDALRGDRPAERYVYRPFIIDSEELVVCFGRTPEEALSEVNKLRAALKDSSEAKRPSLASDDERRSAAFLCAVNSLESMKVRQDGSVRLYAGYPWFYQFWTRDECISLGALLALKQYAAVKSVLAGYLGSFLDDGRLPNRVPESRLGSADGVGWYWKRVSDLIACLKREKSLDRFLSQDDLDIFRSSLGYSVEGIEKGHMKDGLVHNLPKETWMDTDAGGQDTRAGARIEIQALHLNMLRLMSDLGAGNGWKKREESMKKAVRAAFWDGKRLLDGVGDTAVRPNVFLAYYAYPDLLSPEEWAVCFESCMASTGRCWGGLSSIGKEHPLFMDHYTGMDNRSYHRGDSWFFVNNIAALSMWRIDKKRFEKQIKTISEASCAEILWSGAIGHHAEVSDATPLSSRGCLAQAWSAATFIELMLEMHGLKK